jgi:two-component system, response regulator YesN
MLGDVMHKVMLVDDELLDLEGMEKLIDWKRMSMQVVASFHSPLRAYEYFHRHPVDILITDIGMPQMSGLELAEKCKGVFKPLKVLFVSGFQEFAYAQKAVDLQASGYILKPYDDNDIVRCLEAIQLELEEENHTTHWKERMEASRAIVKNELVMRWLEGRVDGRQIGALLTDYELASDSIYSVALLEFDGISRYTSLDKQETLESGPFLYLMEHCDRMGLTDYCMVSAERLAIILHGLEEVRWRGQLEELVLFARQRLLMTVTIGWGKSIHGPENLSLSYEDAKRVLNAKLFHGKDRILTANDTTLHESSRHLSGKMHNRNHILIEQIKTYIEDRLQMNVTLHDTAERFGFSPNHLGVLFKEATGCNFRDFVIHTRIDKAKSMLRDPSVKIYEIAFLVGYQNENYFYRQFKQIVGVTPNEFRTKSL